MADSGSARTTANFLKSKEQKPSGSRDNLGGSFSNILWIDSGAKLILDTFVNSGTFLSMGGKKPLSLTKTEVKYEFSSLHFPTSVAIIWPLLDFSVGMWLLAFS